MELTGGKGYDDAFVYAPVKPVVELADSVLGKDGCLNFFAGPTNTQFSALFNFYNRPLQLHSRLRKLRRKHSGYDRVS